MKKRIWVQFAGIVQGVFFRQKTKDVAEKYGLFGWVKNMDDGSVVVVFEGEEGVIKNAIWDCQQFSPPVKVMSAEQKEQTYTGEFKNFNIVY